MDGNWGYDLGLHLRDLIAGFMGGLVNAFVFNRVGPMAVVSSVIVGALSANYLGEPASAYVTRHAFEISTGVASFLIGLGGMALIQGLATTIGRWRPPSTSGGKEA